MIEKAVNLVKIRGIDGINVDFEYQGNPGQEYRNKFTLVCDGLLTRVIQHEYEHSAD